MTALLAPSSKWWSYLHVPPGPAFRFSSSWATLAPCLPLCQKSGLIPVRRHQSKSRCALILPIQSSNDRACFGSFPKHTEPLSTITNVQLAVERGANLRVPLWHLTKTKKKSVQCAQNRILSVSQAATAGFFLSMFVSVYQLSIWPSFVLRPPPPKKKKKEEEEGGEDTCSHSSHNQFSLFMHILFRQAIPLPPVFICLFVLSIKQFRSGGSVWPLKM